MNYKGIIREKKSMTGNINNSTPMSGKVRIGEKVYIAKLIFANHFEFPSIGDPNTLYIATDEHKIYMFDSDNMIYIIVGSDYNEIDTIVCEL